MKKVISILMLVLITQIVSAQFVKDKATTTKSKAKNRLDTRTDEAIDRGLDKVEDGINNIFKKKDKTQKSNKENVEVEDESNEYQNNSDNKKSSEASTKINISSKYDFVAGEKIIYFDDFSQTEVGDFPANFNTNASGEVVTLNNKMGKWLNMSKNGIFTPEDIKTLPENFTLEFDAGLEGYPGNNNTGLGLIFTTQKEELNKNIFFGSGTSVLYLHPGASQASVQVIPSNGAEINNDIDMPMWNEQSNNFVKISIWRQKGRLRVYANENKLVDMPRFFSETTPYYFGLFRRMFNDCNIFMSNIKFAVGAPDTRNKLITEGKFSTTGILFDVNSDKIKPSSVGVIKEIATVLNENASVKIKIIGHTDSDGDANANLILSQKRAASVKKVLVDEFKIQADRIQTDGKGEQTPIADNNTITGKASNRRVEFLKL